ncbi:DEAD/DEAH box helicase [Gammaproteobacteria bacterium]|nr:DEAD/DEAH box helicase [Gammaproteobacteria bacterium]
MSFKELGLSEPILKSLEELDHSKPSEIQQQAIPVILAGKNLMAAAQTGTGKTGSFVLPMLEMLIEKAKPYDKNVHALVLTPTRELAAQVRENVHKYGKFTNIKSTVVYGGAKIFPQKSKLKKGVDILVATPGRLLDLVNQKAVKLDRVQMLVLDEADHMLDMGFIHDIKKIIAMTPPTRQNLLFSATFSPEIKKLAQSLGDELVEINAQSPNTTVSKIKQMVYNVDKNKKTDLLAHMIQEEQWEQALVFSRTKHGCEKIADYLNAAGIETETIHGDKTQGARTKALREFKGKFVRVLVATDVAARGIDISNLPFVVNFDMPTYPNDYIHRIGRTGRAGQEGTAISLMSSDEHKFLRGIEGLLKIKIDQTSHEAFKPNDKPSGGGRGNPRSRGPRGGKPSFSRNRRSSDDKSGNSFSKPGGSSSRPSYGGKPNTSGAGRPERSGSGRPNTSGAGRPSYGGKPNTSGAGRPERSGSGRPNTSGAGRPSYGGKPNTSGAGRPERSGSGRPNTSGAGRPSYGGKPNTSGAGRPERSGSGRPNTSGAGRPSYGKPNTSGAGRPGDNTKNKPNNKKTGSKPKTSWKKN